MKKSLIPFFLFAATALFVCCQEPLTPEPDPTKPDPVEEVDDYEATIKFSNGNEINLKSNEGSTDKIIFSCDHQWTIQIPEDAQSWLTCDKMSGKSSKSAIVNFTAKANPSMTVRTVTCKVLSGASVKKFYVSQDAQCLILESKDIQDFDKYYKPAEFNFDMLRSDSQWSWCRSRQSEHFIVFWDKQYGEYGLYGERLGEENTSPSTCKSSSMKVDIDDLLYKAEHFYDVNVNRLKFALTGEGKSVLDKYKMQIYILYQSEWLATGSGYDNRIGALWVNPSTCKPVGSTIAHEIGHCFQYMVYCDYILNGGTDNAQGPGWRYGFGQSGAGGNGFWEQCAQWQSMQDFGDGINYIDEALGSYYAQELFTSTHLHLLHPRPRYANYMIQWWWCGENGIDFIGNLWRSAKYPEDPCETYMRLMGFDTEEFNDDVWKYAAHLLTFDMDVIRSYGKNSIGKTALSSGRISSDGDYWRIQDKYSPATTGSNALLMTSAAGKTVKADFVGLHTMATDKYVAGSVTNAGWRYGFVSYNKDGSTTYSEIFRQEEGSATFAVPSNSSKLWFVVTGAPKKYERKAWVNDDETDEKDPRWPWKVKFTNTKPSGK